MRGFELRCAAVLSIGASTMGWTTQGDVRGGTADTAEVVPLRLGRGFLPIVRGTIGGVEENLAIDTGTARSVIDRGIADRLRLSPSRDEMLVFGERVEAETVLLPSLNFGPVRAAGVRVLTAPLETLEKRFGVSIGALVGMDVLGPHPITLNYQQPSLIVGRTGEPFAKSAPLDRDAPYAVVSASIDGHTYRLIVDSGSETIVLFEHAIPARARPEFDGEIGADHLTRTVRLKRFTPRRFSIGAQGVGSIPVFVMAAAQDTATYDGVLGTSCLPGAVVHLDFERRVLGWR